jgi:2-dehydropantoate 2-reductase
VILATKAMDVEAAAEAAHPHVGADTLVLSIQNGLGGPDIAARVLGDDRVAVGVAGGFGASIVEPGHAHHHGLELIRLGERRGPVSPRIEAIAEVWRGAGFNVRTFDDVSRPTRGIAPLMKSTSTRRPAVRSSSIDGRAGSRRSSRRSSGDRFGR